MKTKTATIIYLVFGVLLVFNSIALFSISREYDPPFSRSVTGLDVLSLMNMFASLLFLGFMLWDFSSSRAESLRESDSSVRSGI